MSLSVAANFAANPRNASRHEPSPSGPSTARAVDGVTILTGRCREYAVVRCGWRLSAAVILDVILCVMAERVTPIRVPIPET